MKKCNRNIEWRKTMKGPEMDDVKDMRADYYNQQKQIMGGSNK